MSHPKSFARAKVFGLTAIACSVLLLTACGGGGNPTASAASTSVQYQSAFAVGRISGFGSIVINGVHYDESAAAVADDDGVTHNSSELKLGMVAEVEASNYGQANNVTTATAQSIIITSLMRGPVDSVGTDSLVVLGQTVKVTATTVFDDTLAGGLTAIKTSDVVKIYGTLDTATDTYTATRIEPQSSTRLYGLRGLVTAYDTTLKTLNIGNTLIDVSAVMVPAGLKIGDLVRVRLQTTQVNGAWVAASVKSGLVHPHDNDHSEVEGTISDFTSSSSFSIDGLPVDGSKAEFPNGTTGLTKGVRVEVEGAVVNGVLMATTVKIKTDEREKSDGFEVDGKISSVDTTKSTFVVRGVTVSYAGSVNFVGGTATDLLVNSRVEVQGSLAADGTTLNATKIRFDH
jgi:hypothetical protein